jgi:hypothetical protein
MADPELTDRIIAQGKALVRAIEALGTIEPTGPTERVLAGLLLAGYKRKLRAIPFSIQSASGLPAGGSSAAPLASTS